MSDSFEPQTAESVNVMLVSAHDWFASALQAVLEPEGFVFARVRAARVALRDAALIDPDVVILDEGLPDMEAPDLAASLTQGPLRPSIPILVYSPNFWHESEQAAAMRAGAWDIIKEPVRSNLIVAKLRRLLQIKRLIEVTEEGSLSDAATGLFNLAGMMRMLRVLGATARRQGVPLSCVVLGPTDVPAPDDLEDMRRRAASLCNGHTREADVCGWMGDAELGIVLYDTDAAGVTSMVRRLSEKAEAGSGESDLRLSAGIVELTEPQDGDESGPPRGAPMAGRIASLSRVAAAHSALRQAREAGGGIRIAESA